MPPKKRSRVTSTPSMRVTRSASTPAPPAAVAPLVLDDTDDEDEQLELSGGTPLDAEMEHDADDDSLGEIELSDDDAEMAAAVPLACTVPPGVLSAKGKLSPRKQFMADATELSERWGPSTGQHVRNFKRGEEESVTFQLWHPASFARGLRLVLMVPEVAGYPVSHQLVCYTESEITPEIEGVLAEISELGPHSDRSIEGVVDYLISRLIRHEPAPQQSAPQDESDEELHDEWDDMTFGIGDTGALQHGAMRTALRKDFKLVIGAGYRPGYTRVSELENVVSIAVKVNSLGIPLRALQAWDANLITGEVKYLVLLCFFGARYPLDMDNPTKSDVRFAVGVSPKYKPSRAAVAAASRSLTGSPVWTKDEFEAFSLSAPLGSLMNDKFQQILLTRRRNSAVGWAAAEGHCLEYDPTCPIEKRACTAADTAERELASSYQLPIDHMARSKAAQCFPLLAFAYLVRRFVMCASFCVVCYKKQEIVSLKPFVCENPLCLFQYQSLHLGPSLELEIVSNAAAVDLLIQLAYAAAKNSSLVALPDGLELQVPVASHVAWRVGDPTVPFDSLDTEEKNRAVATLIAELPPVSEMKDWLEGINLTSEEQQSSRARKLATFKDSSVSLSAWKVARWVVASNTAYIKLIEEEDELVQGIDRSYRQFRLVVGSPAKEHAMNQSKERAAEVDSNSRVYPTLFCWHGSAVNRWHEILRVGLNFKETVNGRAYGHGVYFAKEGSISLGTYATFAVSQWANADFGIGKLAAICEVVNLPKQFVSSDPYLVVNKLDWIQCRYLIVQRGASANWDASQAIEAPAPTSANKSAKFIPLDPLHRIVLNSKNIDIPDILPKLEEMDRQLSNFEEDELTLSDTELLREPTLLSVPNPDKQSSSSKSAGPTSAKQRATLAKNDPFVPVSPEILDLIRLLPPPAHPNPGASLNIQREMKSMLLVEEEEGPTQCGFHFDPERSEDNLFTWVIELLGFDPKLPLSLDMKAKGVTSLLMEVRFPETFPMSPPFFRIVYPRFLPFIRGGGGHVTGGGSLCMDLLTSNGWSPAYKIDAILLQIRLAISNLEPNPARLDPTDWNRPYSMSEAIAGFERAAATHNWTVDPSFKLLR